MPIEKRHLANYQLLLQFFLEAGHANVPNDHELFEWTQTLRQSRLKLSKVLTDGLDSMAFNWIMHQTKDLLWQSRYFELMLFKRENGHCRIPTKYKKNKPLGTWISTQLRAEKTGRVKRSHPSLGLWAREQKAKDRKNTLAPDRKKLLLDAGFQFG
ncbi:MAG: helicase associated domain-containing protein [Bacteroidota bacterium]